jgi:hypothetical protein
MDFNSFKFAVESKFSSKSNLPERGQATDLPDDFSQAHFRRLKW